MDLTLHLSDEILSRILSISSPNSASFSSCSCNYSQVCKRWLNLHGRLRSSIKLLDWSFLENGRMASRFPNLTDIDLTSACLSAMPRNYDFCHILLTLGPSLSIHLEPYAFDSQSIQQYIDMKKVMSSRLDEGLKLLARAFPDLRRLCLMDVRKPVIDYYEAARSDAWLPLDDPASYWEIRGGKETTRFIDFSVISDDDDEYILPPKHEGEEAMKVVTSFTSMDREHEEESHSVNTMKADQKFDSIVTTDDHTNDDYSEYGLSYVAQTCSTLQELELHHCTDKSLHGISACKNLQILRIIGSASSLYCQFSTITDIGLTILARNCIRLVKLELSGCEGSYDGIAAIGQCCGMLEELIISNLGFSDGWIAGLALYNCLKILRFENCKHIDNGPRPSEHLGYCLALECLQLVRCNLRDEDGFHALMMLSKNISELYIEDCWGLNDKIFSFAAACRYMKCLSLEGCSPLTTMGLENVVLSSQELQALRVVHCNNIKDFDLSEALALQIYSLKELKWRPDVKRFLQSTLSGTDVGQYGGNFFKKWGLQI